jgi:molybdopterin molybdotransferase
METKLTWRQARDQLLDLTAPLPQETVPLSQAAGRILAQPLTALRDVPPFARSPFDGYAFQSGDTAGPLPVTLTILEEIPAGSVPTCTVVPGAAVKILTGAPIPPGADAVSKFEETDFTPDTVTLKRAYCPGENIALAGEDIAIGTPLAQPGQVIDAGLAGTLAAQGFDTVSVYRRPVVGVITTGSELAPSAAPLAPGKIPDSNRYMLDAALRQYRCEPRLYQSPADDTDAIAQAVDQALTECDALITTGGVSVGDYDLTAQAFQQAGVDLVCGDLRLKPGGKSCFGFRSGKPVLGLSGNPASSMTCFYAVVLPVLRQLCGLSHSRQPEFSAKLGRPFPKSSPQPRLLRGQVTVEDGQLIYLPGDKQSNGALHTLAGANALAEIPPGTGPLEAGAAVNVIYIG